MSTSVSSSSSSRPTKVNLRSTAVKRIMQEARELADPQTDDFVAAPLESDIFEWHCTMRGVQGSEYDGGLYHLRILLPSTYPMSAPDIILLTPNGRFELGKKICIDGLTSFHAGSWQPAWGVRTAILGLRSFWMQSGEALSAIGALDCSREERRRLAKLSRTWTCPTCGVRNIDALPDTPSPALSSNEHVRTAPSVSTPAESVSLSTSIQPQLQRNLLESCTNSPIPAISQPQGRSLNSDEVDLGTNVDSTSSRPQEEPSSVLSGTAITSISDTTDPVILSSKPTATMSPPTDFLETNPHTSNRARTTVQIPTLPPVETAPSATVPLPVVPVAGGVARQRPRTPVWFDGLIGILIAIILGILARRA